MCMAKTAAAKPREPALVRAVGARPPAHGSGLGLGFGLWLGFGLVAATAALAQPPVPPVPATPPTLEEVRAEMAIPSQGVSLRGQVDTSGYAARPEQMARIWDASGTPPAPDSF